MADDLMADDLLLPLILHAHITLPVWCFLQEELSTRKMGTRMVLTFVLEGKEHSPIVVPAVPWLSAVALKV